MSRKIRLDQAQVVHGSRYPSPYDAPCRERVRYRLGDVAGLSQFGVNFTRLHPGAWSSQRHWHQREDEFVYVLEGELVLVTNEGEETLGPGDCVAFKAGTADGHHLKNESNRDAVFLEIGAREADKEIVEYPDIDLRLESGRWLHRDGTAYETETPRLPKASR